MSAPDEKIKQLQYRLDALVRSQIDFQKEIIAIRAELSRMIEESGSVPTGLPIDNAPAIIKKTEAPPSPIIQTPPPPETYQQTREIPPATSQTKSYTNDAPSFGSYTNARSDGTSANTQFADKTRADLERFIGENLISKIGIVVLILGVGIGAKYAIDNGWITPLMRIIFGYAIGFALIGIAIRLKEKYLNFSSVLISGGMAIMYFVTYFAYVYYDLISQLSAFALMLMFTIFTVVAALNYSRQVIAHIGLVGAYATPFLLSSDSGNYPFLFSYLMIINSGILVVSVWKYWKPLFYTSFIFTWLIYGGWLFERYDSEQHFYLGFGFLGLNFLLFYTTFLVFRLRSDTNLAVENIGLVLTNSFLFYLVGCYLIDSQNFTTPILGLYTIGNAFIHLCAAFAVNRFERTSEDIHYLLRALVLAFVTISIPVQFDGVTTTFIWSAMAVIIYIFGRAKEQELFEIYSMALFALAGIALFIEWGLFRERVTDPAAYQMFGNRTFIAGIIYAACLAAAAIFHKRYDKSTFFDDELKRTIIYCFTIVAVLVLYNAIRFEIANHFFYEYLALRGSDSSKYDVEFLAVREENTTLSLLWQMNFSLLYFALIGLFNYYKLKDHVISAVSIVITTLLIVIFVIAGFTILGELRDTVLLADTSNIGTTLSDYILLRNISLAVLALGLFMQYLYSRSADLIEVANASLKEIFECYLSLIIIIVLSSELINWTAIFSIQESYKYGLSLLWGSYALLLIGIGIFQNKKHLRFTAFGLFGITLVKLFLYDTSELGTLEKTAVFISVGVLLLVVAFLYNKYKDVIINDSETNNG